MRLVASEPLIRQPLSLSFDDRGRLWLLQYIQYPNPEGLRPVAVDEYLRTKYDRRPEPPPKGPRGHDIIAILEDTDGDGVMDRAKPFLTGLNLASGMALGYGGVFVVQPPYLLFYRDANGDDVPDGDPEVLLTGFGMEDAARLCQLAHLGAGRLAVRCAGEHRHGQYPRDRIPAGNLAVPSADQTIRALCRGGRQHLGNRFRSVRQPLRRRQHVRASVPPRAGGLLRQGIRKARTAAQPVFVRLFPAGEALRAVRRRADRRLQHLPGRGFPRAVQ